jgi:hypothetical protein
VRHDLEGAREESFVARRSVGFFVKIRDLSYSYQQSGVEERGVMEPHLQIEIAVPLIRFAGLTEVLTHKSQAVSCINKPSRRVLVRVHAVFTILYK